MGTCFISVAICESDFVIEVDYNVTHRGFPPSWDEPGDPVEWEIREVNLYREWRKNTADILQAMERRSNALEIPIWLRAIWDEDGWLEGQVNEHVQSEDW